MVKGKLEFFALVEIVTYFDDSIQKKQKTNRK